MDKSAACSHTVRGTRVQCQLPAGHEGDHIAPGPASQGHRDAELERVELVSTERLGEIARECLLRWDAYPTIPGAVRWKRNGITAVMELQRRAES